MTCPLLWSMSGGGVINDLSLVVEYVRGGVINDQSLIVVYVRGG